MSDKTADNVELYMQGSQPLMPSFSAQKIHTTTREESPAAYDMEQTGYAPPPPTGSPFSHTVNGVDVSPGEEQFFNENLAQENSMPPMLPRPYLDMAAYRVPTFSDQKAMGLVRDAYEEPELPENPTPEEQIGYLVRKERQRKARLSLTLAQYKLADRVVKGDIREQALAQGLDPYRSEGELSAILAHSGWGMYNDLMLDYGEIPQDVALDPAFLAYATPETMSYVWALHELKQDTLEDVDWSDRIANGYAYTMKANELAREYNDLSISLEEKTAEEARLAWQLHSDGTLFGLSSMAAGMIDALTTEEGLALIATGAATGAAIGSAASPFGAVAGGVAGAVRGALSAGIPAAFSLNSFELARASGASQVQQLRGDSSQEAQVEALNGTGVVTSSLASAALDVAGLGMGMKTVGSSMLGVMRESGSKLAGRLGRSFDGLKTAQAKAGVQDAAQQAADRIETFRNNLDLTFRPMATSYVSEVATEGAQGAIERAGINADSGQSGGIEKAFWDNAMEAADLMMYISPFAGARGIRQTVRDLHSLNRDISKQARAAAEDTVAGDTDLNRNGAPNKSAEVLYRTTAANNVYFYIDDLIQLRNSGAVDFSLIQDPRFQNLEAQKKRSSIIGINRSVWVRDYANRPEFAAFRSINRTGPEARSGAEAVEDAAKVQDPQWRQEKIIEPLTERELFMQDMGVIQNDIYYKLNQSEVIRDTATTELVVRQVSNFIEALHDVVPGMRAIDIYNEINPQINERVLDTRPGSSPDAEPSFDPETFSFNLDRNAGLATIEHELGHYYFEAIHKLYRAVQTKAHDNRAYREARDSLGRTVKELADWSGYASYEKLDPAAKRKVHENFAIGLVRSVVSGKVDTNNPRQFMRFRRFLMAALKREMEVGLTPEEAQNNRAVFLRSKGAEEMTPELETEYLLNYLDRERKTAARRFNFSEIKRHRQLDRFVEKMILSESKREEFEQKFPLFDDLLQRLRVNLTDPDDIAVIEKLEEDNLYLRASTQSSFDSIMTITGNTLAKGYKKIAATIEELKKYPNYRSIPRYRLYQAFKRARGLPEFKENYRKAYNVARRDYVNQQYSDIIQGNKLARKDVLSYIPSDSPLYRTLRERGLIADKGGLPLSVRAASPAFKPDLRPYVAYSRTKAREVMFLEALATHQNVRRQALNSAMMKAFEKSEMAGSVTAILNDIQERAMQTNLRKQILKGTVEFLKQLMGKRGIQPGDLNRESLEVSPESFANTMIDNMRFGDLRPMRIQSQSSYYQRRALTSLGRDDLQTAALLLEQAEYLTATTGRAFQRRKRLVSRMDRLRKLLAKNNGTLKKDHDPERIAIARALLGRIGLMPPAAIREARLIMERFGSDAQKADLARLLNDTSIASHYSNLTVRALESVLDAVEEQIAFAKEDHTSILEQNGINHKAALEEMIAAAEKLPVSKADTVLADGTAGTQMTVAARMKSAPYRGFQRYLLKPLQLFQALDRFAGGPVFEKYFYRPFREKENAIKAALAAYRADMTGVFAETEFKKGTFTCTNLKVVKPSSRGKRPEDMTDADYIPLTLGASGRYKGNAGIEALSLVLHMGNESNFKKLCGGYNVTKEQFMVDFNRLWEEGFINPSVIKAANAIWKRNQDIFIEAQKAHKACHGFYARELEARPIICPDGTVATGGYVPALTNPLHHNFEHIATDIDQMLNLSDFQRTKLTKAQNERWAQERAESFAQPLSLDPEALLAQNERLIRYAENAPLAQALLKMVEGHGPDSQQLQALLYRYDRDVWKEYIVPWLGERVHGVSNPVLSHPVVRWLNTLVRQTGAAIMCANISNSIQQSTGLVTAMSIVPAGELMRSFSLQFDTAQRQAMNERVMKSGFMKQRLSENQISIEQSFHNIMLDPKHLEGWQKVRGYAAKAGDYQAQHAYFMQKGIQNIIDRVVWDAAFRDALDRHHMNEKDAIAEADNTVIKTQTSYDDIDKNFMEKTNPLVRALNMFGSYAWSVANLIYGEWVRAGVLPPGERYKRRAWVGLTAFYLPTVMADLINKAFSRQGFESDDDDTLMQSFWMDNLIGSQLRMGFGMIPFFGQFATAAYNEAIGQAYYTDTRFNSPVFTTFDAAQSAVKNFLDDDKDWKYSDMRNLITGISAATGMSFLAPAGRTLSYAYGVATDQIRPADIFFDPTGGGVDFFIGLLTGKVSKDSKNI